MQIKIVPLIFHEGGFGGGNPGRPAKPPAPPLPADAYSGARESGNRQRRKRGFLESILTSTLGEATGQNDTAIKTLLGG